MFLGAIIVGLLLPALVSNVLTLGPHPQSDPVLGDSFKPENGQDELGQEQVTVGEPLLYYLWTAERQHGTAPIHIRKIEVRGLPAGFVFDRVGVVPIDGRHPGRTAEGPASGEPETAEMRPINEITIKGPCVGGGNPLCYGWMFYGIVHITRPGAYVAGGIRVTYELDGRTYYQDFGHYIAATTGLHDIPPIPAPSPS